KSSSQCEGIADIDRLHRKRNDQLVGVDEVNVPPSAQRRVKSDVEIADLQLVFDKRATCFAVLLTPFNTAELHAEKLGLQLRAAIRERVGHRRRSRRWIVIELRAR